MTQHDDAQSELEQPQPATPDLSAASAATPQDAASDTLTSGALADPTSAHGVADAADFTDLASPGEAAPVAATEPQPAEASADEPPALASPLASEPQPAESAPAESAPAEAIVAVVTPPETASFDMAPAEPAPLDQAPDDIPPASPEPFAADTALYDGASDMYTASDSPAAPVMPVALEDETTQALPALPALPMAAGDALAEPSPQPSAAPQAEAPAPAPAQPAPRPPSLHILDERIPPLRLTPFQRKRRVSPLSWGWLGLAALLLLAPALLVHDFLPSLSALTPFGGPPDRIPRGAVAWATATAKTPLNPADRDFGAQTYPVDPAFAASYAARGGKDVLGPALTPAFNSNLGLVQFFSSGALLIASDVEPGSASSHSSATPDVGPTSVADLDPALAREGDLDSASGVTWLPLSHALLSAGSAAPIGGGASPVTYTTLRTATLAVNLAPAPASAHGVKSNAPLPQTLISGQSAFVVEGSRAGKLVGHSIPAPIWSYITQAQVAPDGWLHDIGEPLTEPLRVTVTGSDGQQRHLLAQAFWQTIIVADLDDPQATAMEPVGLDYLRTIGAPAAHPTNGVRLWTTQNGALRSAPGSSSVAVSLGANAGITLTGAAQWAQGALWYAARWSVASRSGSAWVAANALTATQPSGPLLAGFDTLSPSLAGYLNGLGDDAGAVVYDVTRNTTYTYHPDGLFTMASSAKVPLLVSYLSLIESQGRAPNGFELATMTAMIENSDNNAAQVIYDTIGYDGGQQSYMHSWGITDYTSDPNGWGWGAWSPADMVHLLTLLQEGKVLNSADRALAFNLMENVESDQRFGVGDTAPANATVAMKDGWVNEPDGPWAVNSSGIVTVGNETYIVAVYTKEQNSFGAGEDIVNHVCGAIAQALK